jgi:hypothetical protein
VNPHQLHEFGAELSDDVHRSVRPAADRLRLIFEDGVTFGASSPSADLKYAAAAYHDCLAGVNAQLHAVVESASVLADAAQQIAARYASSDTLADAKAKDVLNAFQATARARADLAKPLPQTRYQ